jgi:hypothetical protein
VKKKAPPKKANLELPFGWIKNLRERGRAEEIEPKAKAASELLAHLQGERLKDRPEHYATFMVEMTAAELHGYLDLSRKAEEHLKRLGWHMDEAGKITRNRKGKGADLLGELVWPIYVEKYREEYCKATKAKKRSIRKKIAAALPPIFNDDELSPDSGAPIYWAIRNREKRSR